jgi:hypothetical protein
MRAIFSLWILLWAAPRLCAQDTELRRDAALSQQRRLVSGLELHYWVGVAASRRLARE